MQAYLYVHMHLHTYTFMHTCICIHTCICMYIYICTHTCICNMYTYMHAYIRMYTCIHVHVHISPIENQAGQIIYTAKYLCFTRACTYIPHRKPSRTAKSTAGQNYFNAKIFVFYIPHRKPNRTAQSSETKKKPQEKIIYTAKYLCFLHTALAPRLQTTNSRLCLETPN